MTRVHYMTFVKNAKKLILDITAKVSQGKFIFYSTEFTKVAVFSRSCL